MKLLEVAWKTWPLNTLPQWNSVCPCISSKIRHYNWNKVISPQSWELSPIGTQISQPKSWFGTFLRRNGSILKQNRSVKGLWKSSSTFSEEKNLQVCIQIFRIRSLSPSEELQSLGKKFSPRNWLIKKGSGEKKRWQEISLCWNNS